MLRNVRVPVSGCCSTTSAVSDNDSVTLTSSVSPAATVTSCRAVEKFTSRNVIAAGLAGTPSMRYSPVGPLTAGSIRTPLPDVEVDDHPRQHAAGLVRDDPGHRAAALGTRGAGSPDP